MARRKLPDPSQVIRDLQEVAAKLPSSVPLAAPPRFQPATADDYAGEIGRLWRESQERFLKIGDYLLEAKERLPHGEFMPMIEQKLPFSHPVAYKLMRVAGAVRQGLLPADKLPQDYTTAYMVVTLPPEARDHALAQGVIHPAMRRAEAQALRKAVSAPPRRRTATISLNVAEDLADALMDHLRALSDLYQGLPPEQVRAMLSERLADHRRALMVPGE